MGPKIFPQPDSIYPMTPQQLLVAPVASTPELALHELFETQAAARPDAVAVIFGREEVTYAELEARANRVARHLQKRGVARGSAVSMLLPRSIDAYVTLLAILKAGAGYVPVDPTYPADRVAYILQDSGASVLVTAAGLAARHQGFRGAVVRMDADAESIAAESPACLPRDANRAEPEDLCYIIYTSGSTGRPKGVMVEHRNACRLVRAEGRIFAVKPEDRVYQGASLAFDLAVEEVWLAFHAGATLVAATAEMAHAGPDLSRQLAQHGVTVLSCAPTLLSMMEEDVACLRLLILGGETCSNQLVARWAKAGRRIVNTYGPTEATVIATYTDVSPDQPVTIGRPVRGYHVHILDDELRTVRHGQTGEICIGGAGVARGYVGLPAETRARFVPDPFAAGGSTGRIYRTGDLGRIDNEGKPLPRARGWAGEAARPARGVERN
jgi:amino acid adenylation domain-containing protein